jgi:tetratricopeptide (TPR) repeat protein
LDYGKEFKEKGSNFFASGDYRLALDNYKRIVDFLKAEARKPLIVLKCKSLLFYLLHPNGRMSFLNYGLISVLEGEEEETRKSLLLASYLNQALCNLKLNRNPQAIRNCDDALDMDKNNPKGLYRRGLARLAINEPQDAKDDFMTILQLEPDNKAALSQIKLCDRKIIEHQKKEKLIFQKMFSSIGKPDKSVRAE